LTNYLHFLLSSYFYLAGKSSVIDAIEWAVFNRSAKAMRASKNDDLICNGKDFTRIVAVFKKGKACFTITKEHQRGGRTRAFAVLSTQLPVVEGADKVGKALLDFCSIDVLNLERILIKQMSASSVACSRPKILLSFLEVVIGTDKIYDSFKACISNFSHLNSERTEGLTLREKVQRNVETIQPSISSALDLKNEEKILNQRLFKLYKSELNCIKKQEIGLSTRLQTAKTCHDDVSSNIATLTVSLEVLRKEIKISNMDEKKKRRARDAVSSLVLETEGDIETVVLERKRAVQKANLKAKKIKSLLTSVRVMPESFFDEVSLFGDI
jgi:chromosome segregation ATPase